jgi:hypothetical protein
MLAQSLVIRTYIAAEYCVSSQEASTSAVIAEQLAWTLLLVCICTQVATCLRA